MMSTPPAAAAAARDDDETTMTTMTMMNQEGAQEREREVLASLNDFPLSFFFFSLSFLLIDPR